MKTPTDFIELAKANIRFASDIKEHNKAQAGLKAKAYLKRQRQFKHENGIMPKHIRPDGYYGDFAVLEFLASKEQKELIKIREQIARRKEREAEYKANNSKRKDKTLKANTYYKNCLKRFNNQLEKEENDKLKTENDKPLN